MELLLSLKKELMNTLELALPAGAQEAAAVDAAAS
jgi:hypothetical protein